MPNYNETIVLDKLQKLKDKQDMVDIHLRSLGKLIITFQGILDIDVMEKDENGDPKTTDEDQVIYKKVKPKDPQTSADISITRRNELFNVCVASADKELAKKV